MPKLTEVLGELADITDRQRIWQEVINVLGRFVDSEIGNREKLKKDDGTEVSPRVIEAVIAEIQKEKIKPLDKRVSEIGGMEIKDAKEQVSPKGKGKSGEENGGEGAEAGGPEAGADPVRRAKGPGLSLGRNKKPSGAVGQSVRQSADSGGES